MTPLQASTQLLLHFNEADGQFVDSSPARRRLTVVGTVSASATAKFGSHAMLVANGAYNGIVVPGLRQPGRAPFTMSAQIRRNLNFGGGNPRYIFAFDGGDLRMEVFPSPYLIAFRYSAGGTLVSTTPSPLDAYVHVEASRDDAGTFRLFVNGVLEASASAPTVDYSFSGIANATVGAGYINSATSFDGLIDEVQFVSGYCLNSANFTPPAAAYDDPPAMTDGFLARSGFRVFSRAQAAAVAKLARSGQFIQDRNDGGRGFIVGTVKEDAEPVDTPLRRRVRLFRDLDGRFVRETWSDATTGAYAFTGIDPSARYSAVAYDHEGNHRAVIADNLQPELA